MSEEFYLITYKDHDNVVKKINKSRPKKHSSFPWITVQGERNTVHSRGSQFKAKETQFSPVDHV